MSRPVRRLLAGIVALAVTAAIGALTRVPYSLGDRDLAAVRLSWRLAGNAIEECRARSAAELAELPAHMRQPEVCESYVPPYRLRVRVDDETIEDILVLAGGARENRPIYVYSELRVAPGPHELDVLFWQEEVEAAAAAEAESGDDHGTAQTADGRRPAPARLELHETLRLAAGQVALVTYDREARTLVLR